MEVNARSIIIYIEVAYVEVPIINQAHPEISSVQMQGKEDLDSDKT